MSKELINILFHFDSITVMMLTVVGVIGITIVSYSLRYMRANTQWKRFITLIISLLFSVSVMVAANHLILLCLAWVINNTVLTRLIAFEQRWKAAQASAHLARKTFYVGYLCLFSACSIFYFTTGHITLDAILQDQANTSKAIEIALSLLLITSLTQSAVWPFQGWLISSLNSPTPVSALMHAGLISAGGYLLIRFAPLYLNHPNLLLLLFSLGLLTVLIGSLWKLMQPNIKGMLACSTMAQMGFMVLQCGLGNFAAALIHLCCHALFKSHLFLASNNVGLGKKYLSNESPSWQSFMLALVYGGVATFLFTLVSGRNWLSADTHIVLIAIIFITLVQIALTALKNLAWQNAAFIFGVVNAIAFSYGSMIKWSEHFLISQPIEHGQPLSVIHLIGLTGLFLSWLLLLFSQRLNKQSYLFHVFSRLYVKMLNASQPHPSTVTAHRNHYQL